VKLRRAILMILSIALGLVLLGLLIRFGKINLSVTLRQLQSVSWTAFAELVLLTGLHVYLSNQKWRTIDAVLRGPSDVVPSASFSFVLTSAGVAFGQILPVQLSMAGVRTLGTYFHGKPVKRGTIGTFFEQSFDVIVVLFLAVASLAVKFFKTGAVGWLLSATIMVALAFLTVDFFVRFMNRLASACNCGEKAPQTRRAAILQKFSEMRQCGLLQVGLARRLLLLSTLRFVIQVLMAKVTTEAIGVQIPIWQLAAAIPFVVIACVIAVTPGGLGVNELSYATALNLFGTPLSVGAQWAFANRIMVAASCATVAIFAIALLLVEKLLVSARTRAIQES